MFWLCENMKWNHLPRQGSLGEQSPELLERFSYIFSERNKHQHEEDEKRDRDMKSKSHKGASRSR